MPPSDPNTSCSPASPTVIVAEDEPSVGELVSAVLQATGYRVFLARDGVQCIQLLEGAHEVAALLLDLTLPRMDGIEVLRRVRALTPALPIVVMSGAMTPALEADIARAGATGCLAKPFRPHELRSQMAAAIASAG
jgi:CheY-like chemotaxis protein